MFGSQIQRSEYNYPFFIRFITFVFADFEHKE